MLVLDQSIGKPQELTRRGTPCNFHRFSGEPLALIERLNDRIVAGRRVRRQVERGSQPSIAGMPDAGTFVDTGSGFSWHGNQPSIGCRLHSK
jgi:hypothetical protein